MAAALFDSVEDRIRKAKTPDGGIPENDQDVNSKLRIKSLIYVVVVVLVLLLGALGISITEGWNFAESLFWAFQTGTTIGEQKNIGPPFIISQLIWDPQVCFL